MADERLPYVGTITGSTATATAAAATAAADAAPSTDVAAKLHTRDKGAGNLGEGLGWPWLEPIDDSASYLG